MALPKTGWMRQQPLVTAKLIEEAAMEEAAEVVAAAIIIEDTSEKGDE